MKALAICLGLLLAAAGTAAADECWGLNRWDCNSHPSCTTFQGDPGHCYFVYHSYCECRALHELVADLCDGAIELTDGTFDFYYNTGDMTNDYTLPYGNSCTGYSANGPDGVAYVFLQAGGTVEVHMQPDGAMDSSLYLVTDCADPEGTCLIGADDTLGGDEETFTYTATSDVIAYIIFDAWTSSPDPQDVHVWGYVDGSYPTPVEQISWGSIKAMYR